MLAFLSRFTEMMQPSSVQVFICVGILVAYLVGLPYMHNEPVSVGSGKAQVAWWRVMLAIGMIPAALQAKPCMALWCLWCLFYFRQCAN